VELNASIFAVDGYAEKAGELFYLLLASSAYSSILKMETARPSETSVKFNSFIS
jgi:hypothetical protein